MKPLPCRHRNSMGMRPALALTALLVLSACGGNPDTRTTADEARVSAKAVADVDAAMADARAAQPLPPAAEPAK